MRYYSIYAQVLLGLSDDAGTITTRYYAHTRPFMM
jgi:hypothetical protein